MSEEEYQKYYDAISVLYTHEVLTPREKDTARARLLGLWVKANKELPDAVRIRD